LVLAGSAKILLYVHTYESCIGESQMTKLTLSVPKDVIREAKVLAVNRDTTLSALVAEGLARLMEPDLRTVTALTLRAWHHFKDATPFIPLAIVAFRDAGFRVEPQKTGFKLTKNGRRYVVTHKKGPNGMILGVHRWGEPEDVIAEINATTLARRVDQVKGADGYLAIFRPIKEAAELAAADADGHVNTE
jgi:hypothetical protein